MAVKQTNFINVSEILYKAQTPPSSLGKERKPLSSSVAQPRTLIPVGLPPNYGVVQGSELQARSGVGVNSDRRERSPTHQHSSSSTNAIVNDWGFRIGKRKPRKTSHFGLVKAHPEQKDLLPPEREETPPSKLDKFRKRLSDCAEGGFYKQVCSDCGNDILDEKGRIITICPVCQLPYCTKPECIEKRKAINTYKLLPVFNSKPSWLGKGDRWTHFIVGMPATHKISKIQLKSFKKTFWKFIKAWKKACPCLYLKGVACEDLSEMNKEHYIHYHLALRPVKRHQRNFILLHRIALSVGVEFKSADNAGGFRKSRPLINYFSKRAAGLFGHKQQGTNFTYSDKFTDEEYYNLFHRRQKLFLIGFTKDERKYISRNRAKLIKSKLVVLPSGKLVISNVEDSARSCPVCGGKKRTIVPYLPNEPPSCIKGEQPSITHEEISLAC